MFVPGTAGPSGEQVTYVRTGCRRAFRGTGHVRSYRAPPGLQAFLTIRPVFLASRGPRSVLAVCVKLLLLLLDIY
ncbi:unnamed protein product [Merluccius merluccius]